MTLTNFPRNALDYVFPVFGGEKDKDGLFKGIEIYGTAFYIKNNFFVTCAHTVNNALQHPEIALGSGYQGKIWYSYITNREIFEANDSAIVECHVERAQSYPWKADMLFLLHDVVSFGYPYGMNQIQKQILLRAFKGNISMVGFNHNFSGNPHYELSFQVPRGLSGAPLLLWISDTKYICGMAIGNEMTDMTVFSSKETDTSGKISLYEKTLEELNYLRISRFTFFWTYFKYLSGSTSSI